MIGPLAGSSFYTGYSAPGISILGVGPAGVLVRGALLEKFVVESLILFLRLSAIPFQPVIFIV